MKSYGLRNKTSKEVLIYIKDFVYNVGSPKIFQFDNGSEFRNNEIQSFMHNMGIEVVYSAPYHPQTNGAVEAVHKEIKRFVSNKFVLNPKDFNLSEALTEANYYHNNQIHSSTGYKPTEIKDTKDESVLNEIKKNIGLSMSKKIFKKNKLLLHNGDKLLLCEHFDIKNNKIKTSKKKGVLNHSIPCIFCKYNKRNSFVEIQAKCDYHNKIKKIKIIYVSLVCY